VVLGSEVIRVSVAVLPGCDQQLLAQHLHLGRLRPLGKHPHHSECEVRCPVRRSSSFCIHNSYFARQADGGMKHEGEVSRHCQLWVIDVE
jgi:hypothetical protein